MINFLKQIFVKNKPKSNDSSNKSEALKDDKDGKNPLYRQQSIIARDIRDSTIVQYIEDHGYAGQLVDEKISGETELIRKSRFFADFDTVNSTLAFARRLLEGELKGGSDSVRSRAIAWCSRFLSRTELEKSEEYLKLARTLGSCPEIGIAEAFIGSQKGDKHTALSILANLNSPLSHSAALMIVAHHEGPQVAIDWLETVGVRVSELDSDGRYSLLKLNLQLAQWDAALICADALNNDDLRETPALHHIVAITHLIRAVPNELRTIVLNQVPFNAAAFPLAADAAAIESRRKALRYFITATEVALQLNCSYSAKMSDEFALWLELKDPSQSEQGIERLKGKLRDPKSALHLIRLGLQFGIKLDLGQVEEEIERQIALHGGITQDAAIARFALAFTLKNPEDVANYIERHRDELAKYYDKISLQFLQIEMLSQAGMPERAKACIDVLSKEGLSETEENRLRRIIIEIEGTNSVEILAEQFRKTDALVDLQVLIEELENRGEWGDLCKYGEIMFARTRSLSDAERLARALNNTQKNERLVEFLRKNSTLLTQSKNLHMIYCWALYNEGDLIEARHELSKLSYDRDNPNYRALQVNLGIASGDWNSLTTFVAKEYQDKEKRSVQELISLAQLAHYIGSPYAKELTSFAAQKGNDNAGVLATAYFLATSAGWEDDPEIYQWLNKASTLSGNDGPIQQKSLKDILDMKPDWDRRESETLQQLSRGNVPIFIAGECLNRSLIHMMLFPAIANLSENDPRRRVNIPIYSGKRQLASIKIGGTVAMDVTTLITLNFLGLLDKALDVFETVFVPHSTLKWLFEEKQKASFHQPSRIKGAHQMQRLLSMGVLEKLNPKTVPDSDLSAQVGDDLALIIAEANKAKDGDTQCIVVRPYPVRRIASLMEEEADLTDHTSIMGSCQAIVDKLRSKGQITVEEERVALSYLRIHEKPWPNQPEITESALLYLDGLAVAYFLHLGLLEKLKAAGFRLIISHREISEANELISYECISDQINGAIEKIRSAVSLRLEAGKIRIGRRLRIDEIGEHTISEHPTANIIGLVKECDAIFIDDRFINQHANMDDGSTQAPILSTLDLLSALVSTESISTEALFEYKTLLRRAGYIFIPISEDELLHHLNVSTVKDNKVIETAELKAIRENILCIRMSTWLQLPKEKSWFDALMDGFVRALKSLWVNVTDLSGVRARSNWILNQINIRGWAHCFGSQAGNNIATTGYGAYVLFLLIPPVGLSRELKTEYWNWVEDMVLAPIKEQYPTLYSWIVEWQHNVLTNIADKELSEGVKK